MDRISDMNRAQRTGRGLRNIIKSSHFIKEETNTCSGEKLPMFIQLSGKVKPRSLDHQSFPFPLLSRASEDILNYSFPVSVVSTSPFHTLEQCDISRHTQRCTTRGLGRLTVVLGNFITWKIFILPSQSCLPPPCPINLFGFNTA